MSCRRRFVRFATLSIVSAGLAVRAEDSGELDLSRVIVSKTVSFLGEATEVAGGLAYANKREFVVDEDLKGELGANVGLIFRFGKLDTAG